MTRIVGPSDPVARALRRDDLLTMAAAADRAVGIVRMREALARRTEDEKSLFEVALRHHLDCARTDHRWAVRSRAWDHAGIIVRFCQMVNIRCDSDFTPEQLHTHALRELRRDGPRDTDLTLGVIHRYHAARNLRLIGEYDEALSLMRLPIEDLYGTGAEPHIAHFLYEQGAGFLLQGQAEQLLDDLGEWDAYWAQGRQTGYSTRYRFDLIRALALWESGTAAPRQVIGELALALGRAEDGAATQETERGLDELTVALTQAECLAALAEGDRQAVGLAMRSLSIADSVRSRWRVIARSRAPLAVVFQRVYGDIALLAARLGGREAAELGLRVALSAKQTGFAARIRTGRTLMNPLIGGLLDDIVAIEDEPPDSLAGGPIHGTDDRAARLGKLHFDLREAVSPMLADTVLPSPTRLADLVDVIAGRHALDFMELPHTLDDRMFLFRTLIRPGGRLAFECFDPSAAFGGEVEASSLARRAIQASARGTARDLAPDDGIPLDWWALARAVLPEELLADLGRGDSAADSAAPVHLLISAHSWLSLLPWAALVVDEDGTRLVQRAVITQCPVLTCLSSTHPPRVEGDALVRLVGRNEDREGVDVSLERAAWGLGESTDGVPASRCAIAAGVPEELPGGRLTPVLTKEHAWQFLHIASHGAGKGEGLNQILDIPREPLSAARALGLSWPTSVLMASCHVGQVINTKDAEPLNFVMALMIGGARCVVAGIASIDDSGTAKVASHMVRAIRRDGLSLDAALRDAQLAAIADGGISEAGWALLSAYVH